MRTMLYTALAAVGLGLLLASPAAAQYYTYYVPPADTSLTQYSYPYTYGATSYYYYPNTAYTFGYSYPTTTYYSGPTVAYSPGYYAYPYAYTYNYPYASYSGYRTGWYPGRLLGRPWVRY